LNAAAAAARKALDDSPRSAAAVVLAVEVDLARGGPTAGLDTYERWLGAKRVDAAYVLRRIATTHLEYAVRQRDGGLARVEALRALVADGDETARASIAAAGPTGPFEAQWLASLGDETAVRSLIAQLKSLPNAPATIDALVQSRSPLAVAPLVEMLSDARDDNRAAAADGLGRLGARDAVEQIKPLLKDSSFPVRLSAARALYQLGDDSGAPLLDQLLASEHAAVRMGAAEALSVRPDGNWKTVARALADDPDQTVQLQAARLMAPYDRELAQRVLDRLQRSENPAVREEAGRILTERVANDFATLRSLLRGGDKVTAVRAAGRILELTR
jgi:HEAT repeat protein